MGLYHAGYRCALGDVMSSTPGPWGWWSSCSFYRLTHETDGDVLRAYIADDGMACIECKEEDRALIAAAPDLLEALGNCLALAELKYGNTDASANVAFKLAYAAIAKAKS